MFRIFSTIKNTVVGAWIVLIALCVMAAVPIVVFMLTVATVLSLVIMAINDYVEYKK